MNNYYNKLLNEIINNRSIELFESICEDETQKRVVEQIKLIAKRHHISFLECYNILTEFAALSQYEE